MLNIYSERQIDSDKNIMNPLVSYSIPKLMRNRIKGKRVAIVDDIINAGAAIRPTYDELIHLGATPIVLGCLIIKGNLIYSFATEHQVPLEEIIQIENNMWLSQECPLCISKQPIERVF
jgi:orotate phosphoribosyltransferase